MRELCRNSKQSTETTKLIACIDIFNGIHFNVISGIQIRLHVVGIKFTFEPIILRYKANNNYS